MNGLQGGNRGEGATLEFTIFAMVDDALKMVPESVYIDGFKIVTKLQNGALILYCEENLDSITTLINLFTGMRPGASASDHLEAHDIYTKFMHGIGFVSEGFWTRKIELEELESMSKAAEFRAQWESVNGQALNEPIWLCVNDWNDAKVFLVETTFRKIITFAYESFKMGTLVMGSDFAQYESPV